MAFADGRKAYGILFLSIAGSIVSASLISEFVSSIDPPLFYYMIIWVAIFATIIGAAFSRFRKAIPTLRSRMKGATSWPLSAKIINAVSWSAPFIAAGIFNSYYQYLVLLGIGVGNLSTFLYIRKYGKIANMEQLAVSIVSLAMIPAVIIVNQVIFFPDHNVAILVSRMLIALSYAIGGIMALLSNKSI